MIFNITDEMKLKNLENAKKKIFLLFHRGGASARRLDISGQYRFQTGR